MSIKIPHSLIVTSLIALALIGSAFFSAQADKYKEGENMGKDAAQEEKLEKGAIERGEGIIKDAWLQGKLEMAYLLNEHLNPLNIDTEVKQGVVYLKGTVETDSEVDLAEEIAKNIDGVEEVENKLKVAEEDVAKKEEADGFEKQRSALIQGFDDATTTAIVKSKLIANENVAARNINVNTDNGVVTLKGEVNSAIEKDLAEQIVRNVSDIKEVRNELKVK